MNETADDKASMPKLKTIVTLIITTAVVVSGVWTFFFVRTMQLKDQQIEILKQSDPQSLKRIENQLKSIQDTVGPLALAFPFDEFNGRVGLGSGASGPTKVTHLLIEAEKLRAERKFDLASAKLKKIEEIRPGFAGATYMQFLIENDKGNKNETLRLAEELIREFPEDNRILGPYKYATKMNVKNGKKKRAEELCLTAIRMAPDDQQLRDYFKQSFGYEPSITKKEK